MSGRLCPRAPHRAMRIDGKAQCGKCQAALHYPCLRGGCARGHETIRAGNVCAAEACPRGVHDWTYSLGGGDEECNFCRESFVSLFPGCEGGPRHWKGSGECPECGSSDPFAGLPPFGRKR